MPNVTVIPAPRVPLVDPETGLISSEWYRYLFNLFVLAGSGGNATSLDDLQVGPPVQESTGSGGGGGGSVNSVTGTTPISSTGGTDPDISISQATTSTDGYLSSTDWNTFNNIATGGVVGPASATDNAVARFDSTTGKLIQNSAVTISDTGAIDGATTITNLDYLDFDTTYATTLGAGQLGWNGNDTLGLGMIGGNVIQHIGEDTFFYVKASAAITKGQLCMFTGAVGSSGVLTAAPSTAIPFAEAIIGVAAEDIANNAFGLIQSTGTLKGVNTAAFLDGDILYYNSAVTGGFTKTFPTSGPIVIVAAVAKAGSGGSGVLTIRVSFQTRVTASTGISVTQGNDVVTVTNTAPDQTVSISAGTGISTSGTYPNFTVTNTAPDQVVTLTQGGTTTITGTYPNFTISSDDQYDGTVTSVDLTAGTGISVAGGPITTSGSITVTNTAPDQVVSLSAGTGISTSGTYPNFTVTNTAPDQTVSISAGTGISTSGTYPNFTVTNTAPDQVVTLTQGGTTTITGTYPNFTISSDDQFDGTVTSVSGTGTVNGITLSGTVTSSGDLTLGGTLSNVSLATQVTGTLPIANGGTGQTTQTAAFDALAPTTTQGDLIYHNGTDNVRLPIGANTYVLTSNGTTVSWSAPAGGGSNITAQGMWENNQIISSNYSVASGNSALSAGPITVNSGVTVTVPSGSRWVIA